LYIFCEHIKSKKIYFIVVYVYIFVSWIIGIKIFVQLTGYGYSSFLVHDLAYVLSFLFNGGLLYSFIKFNTMIKFKQVRFIFIFLGFILLTVFLLLSQTEGIILGLFGAPTDEYLTKLAIKRKCSDIRTVWSPPQSAFTTYDDNVWKWDMLRLIYED